MESVQRKRHRPDRYKHRDPQPESHAGEDRDCEDCGRSFIETEDSPEGRLCPRCRREAGQE